MLIANNYEILDSIINDGEYYYILNDVMLTSDNYNTYFALTLRDNSNMALFGTRNSGGWVEEASGQLGLFYFNGNLRHTWGNAYIDEEYEPNVLINKKLNVNSGNTEGPFVCNRPFIIFSNWSDGAIDNRIAKVEFYFILIYDSAGTLIHEFRPCQFSNEPYPRIIDVVTKKHINHPIFKYSIDISYIYISPYSSTDRTIVF